MVVTKVNVFPFQSGLGSVKALATVELDNSLVLRGLRVQDGHNGLFLSYPVDPFYKGDDFRTVVAPTTRELREHIENCVLEAYTNAVD